MNKTIIVAADVHNKSTLIKCAVDSGKPEKSTWESNRVGRGSMIAAIKNKAKECSASRIVLAYEASGCGYQLHDELEDAGIECFVLPPTHLVRSCKQEKNKTDEKDADLILGVLRGHLLAGNDLPSVHVPSPEQRDDCEITRHRVDLVEKQTGLKAQIQSLLARHRAERPSDMGKGWTRKQRAWLDGLRAKGLPTHAALVLDSLLRQLDLLVSEIKAADKLIKALSKEERFKNKVEALTKLKGVGLLSAMVFLTEIGDPTRFQNRRQVGSYIGLAPSSHESGDVNDRKGHITKMGSRWIRRALCQCVWARIRTDPKEREVYDRIKKKNPKTSKIAIVAIMRRLAVRMWHAAVDASQKK